MTTGATINSQTATISNNTGGNVTLSYQFSATAVPSIAITSTGLTGLKVGQAVSGASIIYTLTNSTYATSITGSNFIGITGLPAGLSVGSATRTSDIVVTVTITGTPTTYNANTATITRPTTIPAANVSGASAAVAVSGTITASAVAMGDGAAVSVPTVANITHNSITVDAVTLTPATGQTAQYAISNTTILPTSGWQNDREFSELTAGTTYYVFARSAANANYNVGQAQLSATGIKTLTPIYIASISGITVPAIGGVPVTSIDSEQYTGTVTW